jgi:hypothetical protein
LGLETWHPAGGSSVTSTWPAEKPSRLSRPEEGTFITRESPPDWVALTRKPPCRWPPSLMILMKRSPLLSMLRAHWSHPESRALLPSATPTKRRKERAALDSMGL